MKLNLTSSSFLSKVKKGTRHFEAQKKKKIKKLEGHYIQHVRRRLTVQ